MTERFEIRSKSFTVKWVNIPSNSKFKWTIKPLKNSINLGIYQQKPEDSGTSLPSVSANLSRTTNLLENLSIDEVNQVPRRYFNDKNLNTLQALNGFGISSSSNSTIHKHDSSSSVNLNNQNHQSNNPSINSDNFTSSSLEEKLDSQLIKKQWIGKCIGDKIKSGTIETKSGGVYAFVFDNTFSKTKSKTILLSYKFESNVAETSDCKSHQQLVENENCDEVQHENKNDKKLNVGNNNNNNSNNNNFDIPKSNIKTTRIVNINGVQYLEGFLMKKKRRNGGAKHFTKRYFSLNLTYSILYYYSNDSSNNIRGNMMITQTVISADSLDFMMYLDSGMEQWVLKAINKNDFNTWISAFNFIKSQNKKLKERSNKLPNTFNRKELSIDDIINVDVDDNDGDDDDDDNDYDDLINSETLRHIRERGNKINPQFEIVENKISSLKEHISDIINDIKVDYASNQPSIIQEDGLYQPISNQSPTIQTQTGSKNTRKSSKPQTVDLVSTQSNIPTRKPSLLFRLKRKGSQSLPSTPDTRSFEIDRPNQASSSRTSEDSARSPVISSMPPNSNLIGPETGKTISKSILDSIFEQVVDLENEYTELLRQETSLRRSLSRTTTHAKSLLSQEFYDAQEYADETELGVVMLNEDNNTDEEIENGKLQSIAFEENLETTKGIVTSLSSSEEEDDDDLQEDKNSEDTALSEKKSYIQSQTSDLSEPKTLDLTPLPYTGKYHFRTDIKPAACEPPSLISILKKGIGKDMTSMTMPISTNEPLSFLQKYTESLEYANLIKDAMESPVETGEKILKITVFAISFLSAYKDKVRSIRKPFNPLLGETFELIRPDLDIRVITEKVVHKPFVMAAHVDSPDWFIDHAICPQQKFYGKTAEIIVDGTLKLKFRKNDETYEWNQPTTTLRNIVSLTGEKYTEPTESVIVKSNTGYKCVVNFISENGRFTSSRSEKVELKVYNDKKGNKPLPLSASGTWTEEIKMNNGKSIWRISPDLPQHEKKYGFTKFACSLNHVDEIHSKCAPTDSRRRPDQRMYENGIVDKSDDLKLKLEEDQRHRRKDANGNDVLHKPMFFKKGSADLDWKFIHGDDGYWGRRERDEWGELVKLW